jgi:hypothetical protein
MFGLNIMAVKMRANEFITELGDKPYTMPSKWSGATWGVAEKSVTLPDGRALLIDIESDSGIAIVNFYIDNTQKITGKGDAYRVFSTVANQVADYARKYKPRFITFTSSFGEQSRIKLYDRLVSSTIKTPEFSKYINVTDREDLWDEDLEFVLDDFQDIRDQKLYVFMRKNKSISEAPLPADWDTSQYRPGSTFKQRLAYALERAKKLGTGSSRVAMTIDYQGRPTVLKVAKNQKGLAQNSVEADILSDGYASQLGILIPIIDYDTQNREPTWVHTELAQKATEKQLCNLIGCENLSQLVNMAYALMGTKRYVGKYQDYITRFQDMGYSEEKIEHLVDYVNTLVDLSTSFDVELGDFKRAANWGLYKGMPVIIDVGFNSNVMTSYYTK